MQNQALGVFGIVNELRVGNSLVAEVIFDINVRVSGQGAAIVREEFLAQPKNFVRLAFRLVDARVGDVRGQPGRLGSPSPVSQPRVLDGVIDRALLDVVLRQETGPPCLFPALERLWILVQQHERLGPQAVRDGVETRALLALFGPRPGALPGIATIRFEFSGRDGHRSAPRRSGFLA